MGSVPVVADKSTMRLEGIITDRDLSCVVLADGLDSRTPIGRLHYQESSHLPRRRRHRGLRACDAGAPGSKNSGSQRIRSLLRNRCSGRSGVERVDRKGSRVSSGDFNSIKKSAPPGCLITICKVPSYGAEGGSEQPLPRRKPCPAPIQLTPFHYRDSQPNAPAIQPFL